MQKHDDEEIDEHQPLKLKYVRIMRAFLMVTGGWPGEVFGERIPWIIKYHKKHIPVQSFILSVAEIYYIIRYWSVMTFFIKGHTIICAILTLDITVRSLIVFFEKYGQLMKYSLTTFHLANMKHKGGYYEEMDTLIAKVSYYFTLYSTAMMAAGTVLFNICPMYLNYKMGAYSTNQRENMTLEFAIYYVLPGLHPVQQFTAVTTYNFYLSFVCAFGICTTDLVMALMVFQIIGHIQILRHNLSNMPKPGADEAGASSERCFTNVAIKMFDEQENVIIHKLLVEYIEHHKLIVTFTEDLSSFFGPLVGINYSFQLVMCCLLLLELSQLDAMALFRFGPLAIIVFGQLVQNSVTFEIVGTLSEKLKDNVYDTPWEFMSTKNRRTVAILLNRVQTPIHVTAMSLTTVGVTTMAQILKTTFSYFAFLRTFNE